MRISGCSSDWCSSYLGCIATAGNFAPQAAGAVYYAIGARFGFDWLRGAASRLVAGDHWPRRAGAALVADLYAYQTGLTEKVLDLSGDTRTDPALQVGRAAGRGREWQYV